MKKVLFILLASVLAIGAQAQKLNIQTALNAIKSGDFSKAKTSIDKATANGSSTAKNGKAWLVKAFIYQAIGSDQTMDPKTKLPLPFVATINGKQYVMDLAKAKSLRPSTPNALNTAITAFNKYLAYDKRADEEIVLPAVSTMAINAYNKGTKAYKDEKYDDAMKSFEMVEKVAGLKNGKFFSSLSSDFAPFQKQMSQLTESSMKYKAYVAYNKGDDNISLPILEKTVSSNMADDNIYLMLARLYKNKKDNDKYMSTIKAGLAKYPDSKALKNEELNFYVTSENPDAAAKKLEDAIAKDPNSAELRFNLGVMYDKLSKSAKDESKKAEYFDKSLIAYKKAIELDPSKSDYQFNAGVLYFNQAQKINSAMNKLDLEDTKNYDAMKKQRDAKMGEALPFLEQAKSTLEKQGLKDELNRSTYKNTLGALKSIYSILGKLDKVKAMNALLKKL